MLNKLIILSGLLLLTQFSFAQSDSTEVDVNFEEFDFDDFGDADDTETKTYCTQKVLYASPTKLISIGYEGTGGFGVISNGNTLPDIDNAGGFRVAFNAPVISRNNFILQLGLNYWGTSYSKPDLGDPLFQSLDNGLTTAGINATIFKPINDKNFLILQGSADANGTYQGIGEIDLGKSLTFSAAALYGWKKDENTMFAVGASRTYRAGQLLYVPAILFNKTWSEKWGLEMLAPAYVNFRRNFGTTGMLLFGAEIEGNAFYIGDQPTIVSSEPAQYLRRGELKPRINYQRQLKNFVWLSAQVGLRSNWRFDTFTTQNPVGENNPFQQNEIGNPLFFNISLNLVSP